MGYRYDNTPLPKPEDNLPKFAVRNGAILDIALPCYYLDVVTAHNTDEHDHLGWPAPGKKPDDICQYPLRMRTGEYEWIDFSNPHPIDLKSNYEGYDAAYVVMDEDVSGLTASASIDDDEPNVIYVRFKAELDFFEDKPQDYRFTVFAHAPARTYQAKQQQERMDQVIRAMVTILPGKKH